MPLIQQELSSSLVFTRNQELGVAGRRMMLAARPSPVPSDEALDDFMQAAAKLLVLSIDPAWSDGVRSNLATAVMMARFVSDFPLPDGAEPAPRYDPENG